ncbi:MAG: sigma 54-interacting transcriptional regulator [Verrucomicrobia bacterium]|nr:sigma 54-interacting transcriptional regulator [Verrucomicrobiota bacterium]MDA1088215.1 sigma 54-interacting transcriptional regulator [Verrucomicrobiota bacterium]
MAKSGQDSSRRPDVEIETLYRISQSMAQQHDVHALVTDVLRILDQELHLGGGCLTLRRPDTDIFVIEASRGLTRQEAKRGQYHLGDGITGMVAKSRRPTVVMDVSSDPRFLNRTRSRRKPKTAFLCVPIEHRRRVIGTISVEPFGASEEELEQDLNFLKLTANIVAEAVSGIREQIEERENLVAENEQLRRQLGDQYHVSNLVGTCNSMRAVYNQIAQVAASPATVLVRGESGTGKELVAKAIHYSSGRKNKPFVSVNCAALPVALIESELFGHERGAFTGADKQRKGRFELAHGGTLFLDEIGDIELPVQVRLLRVLQERAFERVGGDRTIEVDVRIVAATSRNLETAIADGRFREDLYYRLNVFPVHLPPLRERRSDIMLLAEHFLEGYAKTYKKPVKRISTPAINMMMEYHWPGNVRELENCVERAVLSSSKSVIHAYNLPPSLQTSKQTDTPLLPDEGASLKALADSYEREIIVDGLKKFGGNAAACARHLKATKRILNYKIKNLGIDPSRYRVDSD